MRICPAMMIGVMMISAARGAEPAIWHPGPDRNVVASIGDRKLAAYQVRAPFKPYVRELYTPGGRQVLRDQVADHLHHHGLMFAVSVEGVSFWEETERSGKQLGAGMMCNDAVLRHELKWRDTDNKLLLGETRQIEVQLAGGATLATWRSTLEPADNLEQVTLGGNHYYGLGMRLVESMDRAVTFTYSGDSAPGEIVRGSEKLTRGRWVAATGPVEGQTVTVALFDHPANVRHPAWHFTMIEPFAYQSATMNLWKQPLTLKRGESLKLAYGVALLDGPADIQKLDALYDQWTMQLNKE